MHFRENPVFYSSYLIEARMAWSSSGLGRRPLKAEIGGSNPLQATMISKARSDERAFLFSLHDALAALFVTDLVY